MSKVVKEKDQVVIKFAGDSGDGMQLTGTQFTETSAMYGNDIATFPDFPAEIRAPQGTVPGVSGFQVHIGRVSIHTPGDAPDVLVAMNPAALKANIRFLSKGKVLIVDSDSFSKKDLKKAGYEENPLEDGSLAAYQLIEAPISTLTKEALSEFTLSSKIVLRSKNMVALGMVYYMFQRDMKHTEQFLEKKFKSKPDIMNANKKALMTGYNFADTIEAFEATYNVLPAKMDSGRYKNVTGNQMTAWGFLAAAEKAKLPLFLGSYPITPASDILHELSRHKQFGCKTMQAEDEIAAICAAIGASYAGNLAITSTSGPGFALKAEALGLAVSTELPLVVINVQRGGPSTGLPTKTEQADLLQVLYGRNGESPAIVVAASTPGNCFEWAFEAARLSIEHMTPVVLMTDGYLANGAAPWKIKKMADMPDINPNYVNNVSDWKPYQRNEKLVREWPIPGQPELMHRLGGLEKDSITGNVSYDPDNHQLMTETRAKKVQLVAKHIPDQEVMGESEGDLLVVGWGGTYGALRTAVSNKIEEGKKVAFTHFNYIFPLPQNTDVLLKNYKKVLVCELNMGQFVKYLKSEFSDISFTQYNKVQGLPFMVTEIEQAIEQNL